MDTLTPAINPKYALFWHVILPIDFKDIRKGLMRAQVKESRYNKERKENIYFLDVYSRQEEIAGTFFYKEFKMKVVRPESQILKRG